jgi:hypothetical protein
MERTLKKKIIIFLIYLFIFSLIAWWIFSLFNKKETCFDGIKNQNEEKVDCGGICENKCAVTEVKNIIVEETGFIPSEISGKYDFYAKISNPNALFGGKNFDYAAEFKDNSGTLIASRNGSGFILPGERKYIVENSIEVSGTPVAANLTIGKSDWTEFNDYYERPDIKIVNKNYSEISDGAGFAEAKGLLKNDSPFDFDSIKIQIILKDSDGNISALNSTQMKTVKAGEERDFRAVWFSEFPGLVSNMEAQVEVNVFDSNTFLKNYYRPESF